MPIIKSAVKRMHQTVKRKARNQVTKRNLRDETKAFAAAIAAKDAKKAGEELKKVQSALDIAVKKNILKKNTAARKMSRLSAQAKAAGVKPLASAKKAAPKTAKPAAKAPAKKAPAKTVAKKSPAKKAAPKK
jgi:small subunit ribosomal protein S20